MRTETVTPQTELQGLPNNVLARLFFRRLWQRYDVGGVSVGRSLKSDLVEVYLALHEYDDPDFLFDMQELADEAARRLPYTQRQVVFGDPASLGLISSADIGLLCIDALRIWYEIHEGESDRDGDKTNIWERRFVQAVCKIMPIPFFPYIISDKEINLLSKEGVERVSINYNMGRV